LLKDLAGNGFPAFRANFRTALANEVSSDADLRFSALSDGKVSDTPSFEMHDG